MSKKNERFSYLSDVALIAESGILPDVKPNGFITLHSGSRIHVFLDLDIQDLHILNLQNPKFHLLDNALHYHSCRSVQQKKDDWYFVSLKFPYSAPAVGIGTPQSTLGHDGVAPDNQYSGKPFKNFRPEVAVPRRVRPGFSHFNVTFSLNGTSTASFSNRLTLRPSTLSSGSTVPFHAPVEVHKRDADPAITYPNLHWKFTKSPK
ncbi:hypothetical protein AGLY_003576 [Aphis glycines]|uniref:Uncharacterized protein n=1 Tax=Aphis glycines TaxID=307491 RepID=A0A6G0TZ01_APHGL|nr:hypothetical protein AGLY_003576 [Aphis glycines]